MPGQVAVCTKEAKMDSACSPHKRQQSTASKLRGRRLKKQRLPEGSRVSLWPRGWTRWPDKGGRGEQNAARNNDKKHLKMESCRRTVLVQWTRARLNWPSDACFMQPTKQDGGREDSRAGVRLATAGVFFIAGKGHAIRKMAGPSAADRQAWLCGKRDWRGGWPGQEANDWLAMDSSQPLRQALRAGVVQVS